MEQLTIQDWKHLTRDDLYILCKSPIHDISFCVKISIRDIFRFSAKHNSDDEWVLVIKYIQVLQEQTLCPKLSTEFIGIQIIIHLNTASREIHHVYMFICTCMYVCICMCMYMYLRTFLVGLGQGCKWQKW